MTDSRATLAVSLRRVRRRLTAWYVGTLFAIMALLGVGLFATITMRFDRELDASLREDTQEMVRMVRARDSTGSRGRTGSTGTTGAIRSSLAFDPVRDLRIPDRTLYLVDTLGNSLSGETVDARIAAFAREGWRRRAADQVYQPSEDHILRAHADGFTVPSGAALVAIAVADEIELEDRYASLIAMFSVAAVVALGLVAVGGWFLARQSTAPIELAVEHMRRFMADAAHELRTPLTVVRSRAEVALQRPRDVDEYVRALRGIEQDSARLGRIVEDLLMLARADAGERPIERQRVFLDDITLDAAEAARVMADRKSVRLEVADFEEAPVAGDAALLRQLAIILLDNAIKYTAAGGVVRVAVTARGPVATLTVSDTGIGIPADQIGHVFERFYRGDPSRTREPRTSGEASVSEGAGLGLAIARWIADEHGGTLGIESPPGEGTRVAAQFPLAGTDAASSS